MSNSTLCFIVLYLLKGLRSANSSKNMVHKLNTREQCRIISAMWKYPALNETFAKNSSSAATIYSNMFYLKL